MANAKFYGTGRRKSSIARVYLVPGTGKITFNKRDIDDYFGLETLKIIVRQPLEATNTTDKYDDIHSGGEATNREENLRMKYLEQSEHLESVLSSIDDILK